MSEAQKRLETAFENDPDLLDLYNASDEETKLDILALFDPSQAGLYVCVRPTTRL